ncbi:MAG: aminopeptidase P family protein, partial [Pirellulales bacterium]|nr:aminopeptidase P family protein [Pirellulales bacterium]
MASDAVLLAGIPAENPTLFLKVGLAAGDPAAWFSVGGCSTVIVRDIEQDRAQKAGAADHYACPADFAPQGGLDADRATATAQAVAECLRGQGVQRVSTDRS